MNVLNLAAAQPLDATVEANRPRAQELPDRAENLRDSEALDVFKAVLLIIWVAVKELELHYQSPETTLFTIYP